MQIVGPSLTNVSFVVSDMKMSDSVRDLDIFIRSSIIREVKRCKRQSRDDVRFVNNRRYNSLSMIPLYSSTTNNRPLTSTPLYSRTLPSPQPLTRLAPAHPTSPATRDAIDFLS